MKVYANTDHNFGDCIIFLCGLLNHAEEVLVSKTSSLSLKKLIEIADNLEEGHRIRFVDEPATDYLKGPDIDEYNRVYQPMKMMWKNNDSGVISYQLRGGVFNGHLKDTPEQDVGLFVDAMSNHNRFPMEVGKKFSVAECIGIMCEADFHVTIDSGMMHLACCVGAPIHIIKNQYMYDLHVLSNVENKFVYDDIQDFLDRYETNL